MWLHARDHRSMATLDLFSCLLRLARLLVCSIRSGLRSLTIRLQSQFPPLLPLLRLRMCIPPPPAVASHTSIYSSATSSAAVPSSEPAESAAAELSTPASRRMARAAEHAVHTAVPTLTAPVEPAFRIPSANGVPAASSTASAYESATTDSAYESTTAAT